MKEKMSKLFETIKTNKVKVITLSSVAIITLTGAVAGVCAVAKNQGGMPMVPAASELSESKVVASTSSEPSEKEVTKGDTESKEVILISSEKQETSKPKNTENTQDKASSQEDVGSESVASKVEEKNKFVSKEETSSESTVSKKEDATPKKETSSKEAVSTHKHSYTKKVVKATCEKSGYTKYTCSCGKTYKDDKTDELGHLYTQWKITKKATAKSTGLKECKCDKCGDTITETIPKKKKASNIDSKVEIGTAKLTGYPQYTLGKSKITDKRTWGEAPTIIVYDGDCMHVTYYDKNGKKVDFDVEQPITDNTTNLFNILDNGTYVSSYIGSYS